MNINKQSLWIQAYLLRKYLSYDLDWFRGFSTFSDSVWIHQWFIHVPEWNEFEEQDSHTHISLWGDWAKISCARSIGTFRAFHGFTWKGAPFCADVLRNKEGWISPSISKSSSQLPLNYRDAGQSVSCLNMFEAEPTLIHLYLCNPSCPDPCNWRREAPHRKPLAVDMGEYLLEPWRFPARHGGTPIIWMVYVMENPGL